jgi:hypothetical protein
MRSEEVFVRLPRAVLVLASLAPLGVPAEAEVT